MQLYNDQIAVPSDNVAHKCSRPLVPMDGYQREFWKLVQIDQASDSDVAHNCSRPLASTNDFQCEPC